MATVIKASDYNKGNVHYEILIKNWTKFTILGKKAQENLSDFKTLNLDDIDCTAECISNLKSYIYKYILIKN